MAKATVTCTCKTCGAEFTKFKTCYNRAEAERYEEWAKLNYTECPECYYKRMAAENEKKVATMEVKLPEIKAVSDKQKAFAEKLRNQYVIKNKERIERTAKYLGCINAEVLKTEAEKYGSEEAAKRHSFGEAQLLTPYIVLTSTDAHEIIEELKY